MTDHATILARLATLTAAQASSGGDLAVRLCSAARVILGADGAAITVENTTAHRTTLCTTDEVAARLDDLQDVTGEGPCLDAFRHSTQFQVGIDSQPDPRWPEFTRAAWQVLGAIQLQSFPMRPGSETFGAISVYLTGDHQLMETAESAQFLADAIGAALLRDPDATDTAADTGPWSSRAEVHQAAGMVIAQLHLSPDDALAILRAHAYATSTPLTETARQVLNRTLTFREPSHSPDSPDFPDSPDLPSSRGDS